MKFTRFFLWFLLVLLLLAVPTTLLIKQYKEYQLMEAQLREVQFELNQLQVKEAQWLEEKAFLGNQLQNISQQQQITRAAGKRVYLTFDDGPSSVTENLLDLLKEHNVKASFFVLGAYPSEYKENLLRRIVAEGHSLGNHGYSHNYSLIYPTRENFWKDFKRMEDYLLEVTGVRPVLARFPGGSRGSYSQRPMAVMEGLRRDMDRLGYIYVDWNVLGGDVESSDPQYFIDQVLAQVEGKHTATVLFHDTQSNPEILEALPVIIETLEDEGYEFAPLNPREFFTRY